MTAGRRGTPNPGTLFGTGLPPPQGGAPPTPSRKSAPRPPAAPTVKKPPATTTPPPVDEPEPPPAAPAPKRRKRPDTPRPPTARPAAKRRVTISVPQPIAVRLDRAADDPDAPKWRNELVVEALGQHQGKVPPPPPATRRRRGPSAHPTPVQLYLTEGQHEELVRFAESLGSSLSYAVAGLLDQHLPPL